MECGRDSRLERVGQGGWGLIGMGIDRRCAKRVVKAERGAFGKIARGVEREKAM